MNLNLQHAKRAIIISDTHLGARSNSVEWLDVMKDWFHEDFIPKVKENYRPGDILIHCGDVFDNRQSVNLLVLHEGIRLFEELSKIFVDGIYVIAGNHDVMRKTTNDVSSLDTLKYIPNVNILKEPVLADFSTTTALFMPWRTNDEEEKVCLKDFEAHNCNYLFCHTNIRNLRFDGSRTVDEGLNLSDIQSFQRVYSGHIHWGQHRGNVTMVGNPYQMTRSDAGNKKGWYILDLESGNEEFVENEYSPRFIRIYLNRFLDKSLAELKAACLNNRVDLYVPSGYLLKYQITAIIDELSQITKKLEVIPFESDISDDLEFLDENDTTFNIFGLCQKYVDSMKSVDDTSKQRIINKLNQIYIEVVKDEKL
jgi:DNA repair exonuclease SbcCD nuclease subunit